MRSSSIGARGDPGKEVAIRSATWHRTGGSIEQVGAVVGEVVERGATIGRMCRSIKRLREGDVPANEQEIREAALQYVRKVSGFRAPSRRNEDAFDAAVDEVAAASRRLIEAVTRSAG
jgi:hypothetical protein